MSKILFFPPFEQFPVVGVHIPLLNKDLYNSINEFIKSPSEIFRRIKSPEILKIGAAQIFISSPSTWEVPKFSIEDLKKSRKLLIDNDFFLVIHASYLYNLHGVKDINNPKFNTNFERTIKNLSIDLDIGVALDIGVVVHVNSASPAIEECSVRIAKCIDESLTRQSPYTYEISKMLGIGLDEVKKRRKIVLENSAGEGSKRGKNIYELKTILGKVRDDLNCQVFICIDTCHLFAAGDYNISKKEEVVRFFKDFDTEIGNKKLHVIHLNDSLTPFGSHIDRHANICCGHIWSNISSKGIFKKDLKHFEALKTLIDECINRDVPMIMETPGDVAQGINFVYNIDKIVYDDTYLYQLIQD